MWSLGALVTVLALCPTPTIPAKSDYNPTIPFGTKVKASKIQRRQTADVGASILSDRYTRGLLYQQPFVFVNPGYSYPVPTTQAPFRGYVYKKPTTAPTTTTQEPAVEQEQDIDSAYLTPAPPPPSFPEKEFESSPVEIDDSEDKWDIRNSVPGTPGADYPVLGHIPKTSFRCEGRIPGFYADTETHCQVYHRCSDCMGNVRLQMDSFLCPNGTQFNQEILACDWWGNVHCETTENFYRLNEELNQLGPDGKYVEFSGTRQAPPLLSKRVAPSIIPKSERGPLPSIYRSQHKGHDDQAHSDDTPAQTSRPHTPRPRDPILFNEFRKPTAPVTPATKNPIESALDNPDYFDPDGGQGQDPRKDDNSDEDYFSRNEQVEVRSSIEFAQKLDNDPLNPAATGVGMRNRPRTIPPYPLVQTSSYPTTPSTTTTLKVTRTTTVPTTLPAVTTQTTPLDTTFYVTTTTPKPDEDDNEVQPLIGLRSRDRDDDASGFIVNKQNNYREKDRKEGNRNPGGGNSGLSPPSRDTVHDEYLPPTTKPKLDYLPPAAQPQPEYGAPRDSYLPPVSSKQALPAPAALAPYPGNPYLQAPLPQAVVQPSVFNYVPYAATQQLQPHFKVVQAHVPVLNYASFNPVFTQPLGNYFGGGGFDLTTLGSSYYSAPKYVQG